MSLWGGGVMGVTVWGRGELWGGGTAGSYGVGSHGRLWGCGVGGAWGRIGGWGYGMEGHKGGGGLRGYGEEQWGLWGGGWWRDPSPITSQRPLKTPTPILSPPPTSP